MALDSGDHNAMSEDWQEDCGEIEKFGF